MQKALIIIHVVIAIILIVVVLMQHGKQQGLSGAIAGGAETFFGKNKGRTIDAMLKKFTSVFAALFIISSVTLAIVSVSEDKAANTVQSTDASTDGSASSGQTLSTDENGNIVDENGDILITAEQQQQAQAEADADSEAESSTEAENAAE